MPPAVDLAQWSRYLAEPDAARDWLASLGLRDPIRAWRDLGDLAARSGDPTAFARLVGHLAAILPRSSDADRALTNFDRLVAATAEPNATVARLAGDGRAIDALLRLMGSSQFFADMLIREPLLFDWLRDGPARPAREAMIDELKRELGSALSDEQRRMAIGRFRRRQTLRIGHDDLMRDPALEATARDLSRVAEACIENSCRLARAALETRYGVPRTLDGRSSRFVVLALGKLGGEELNYSSDIDLVFLHEIDGTTDGPRPIAHADFFARTAGEVTRLLGDPADGGPAYRVDLRLRPEGDRGPLSRSLRSTLAYYERSGRTWERQALIKARPVAGDLDLGAEFLRAIDPFVYRRYLGAAEIGEIKAMKRRIEQRTESDGTSDTQVKTGRGGLRDVEFVVQFLQLLHGGALPSVRHPNTLEALARLEAVRCIDPQERNVMEDTYRFLRRVEHRLQILFDRQTHTLPTTPEELRSLAVRVGFLPSHRWEDRSAPTQRFLSTYRYKTDLNRRILNHLLHDAFRHDPEGPPDDPVVDLVLDPECTADAATTALGPYRFRDVRTAHKNLLALAHEDSEFLSEARCRHFLAAIAPRLLREIGGAADPDMALTNLEKVSASLGAKAALWELFILNPPSLHLYVRLCSTSQFLSEILINNPGMIDDLMDSLVVDRPQPARAIRDELDELCHGAEDLGPIVLGFRNKEWLRIGARDILNREPIKTVTRELSDVATAIVGQVARREARCLVERHGEPRDREGRPCRWAIVGLGKLGGRELGYQSDLDLIFVYESEGETAGGNGCVVPNQAFHGDLARRILKTLGGQQASPSMLYRVDPRLRPYGSSGPLAISIEASAAYYERPAAAWERLALTRARVLFATGSFGQTVMGSIRRALTTRLDRVELAREVLEMRGRLERSRGPFDLKRAPGGLVDIEFLVQYLQLTHGPGRPELLRSNLWEALKGLAAAGVLARDCMVELRAAYTFLRVVESRLRIVHDGSRGDWPDDPAAMDRLAGRLGFGGRGDNLAGIALRRELEGHVDRVRDHFNRIMQTAADPPPEPESRTT